MSGPYTIPNLLTGLRIALIPVIVALFYMPYHWSDMASGLLFAGPEGVGKKEFALELARGLICKSGGCEDCPVCSRIGVFDLPNTEKGEDYEKVFLSGHPDVGLVIPYKRNLRVGAIRELEREAIFRPFEGGKRAFIIDDAEKMNDSAANALLKTLEEPPQTTHLILITSRPDSLLQTIRSRCQTIRFAPVAEAEIENLLLASGRSKEDAKLAARVSGGSVGRALAANIAEFRESREAMLGIVRSAIVTGEIAAMLPSSAVMVLPARLSVLDISWRVTASSFGMFASANAATDV